MDLGDLRKFTLCSIQLHQCDVVIVLHYFLRGCDMDCRDIVPHMIFLLLYQDKQMTYSCLSISLHMHA
jgi:hypothetical protein